MAKRLYRVGLPKENHYSNRKGFPANILIMNERRSQNARYDSSPRNKVTDQLSSATITLTRQSNLRNGTNASPGLLLHIQSMKKSAFKMLCKFGL